jgi:putative Ca2+/H+ antiporter (TMEM165/GDT1 family)
MLAATLVSLGVVFLAELGDKSRLMKMTYALRHRWWVVLAGVGVTSFLVHALSVTVGHFLGLTLPERPIAFAAAIAFLLFAVWTWRDGRRVDSQSAPVVEPRHVLLAVSRAWCLPTASPSRQVRSCTSGAVPAQRGQPAVRVVRALAVVRRRTGPALAVTGSVVAAAAAVRFGRHRHDRPQALTPLESSAESA